MPGVLAVELVGGKHIVGFDLSLETELDVVAQQQEGPLGQQSARDAIVVGSYVSRGRQLRGDRSEDGGPSLIQSIEPGAEVFGRVLQPASQDFVGPGG
jgi:hypothetical protein